MTQANSTMSLDATAFPTEAFLTELLNDKTPEPLRAYLTQPGFDPAAFQSGLKTPDLALFRTPEIINFLSSPNISASTQALFTAGFTPTETRVSNERNPFFDSFNKFSQPAVPPVTSTDTVLTTGSFSSTSTFPLTHNAFSMPSSDGFFPRQKLVEQNPFEHSFMSSKQYDFPAATQRSQLPAFEPTHSHQIPLPSSRADDSESSSDTEPLSHTPKIRAISKSRRSELSVSPAASKRKGNTKEASAEWSVQHRRELNRNAAARCRQKKLNCINELTELKNKLAAENSELIIQFTVTEKELFGFQQLAKEHRKGGCKI